MNYVKVVYLHQNIVFIVKILFYDITEWWNATADGFHISKCEKENWKSRKSTRIDLRTWLTKTCLIGLIGIETDGNWGHSRFWIREEVFYQKYTMNKVELNKLMKNLKSRFATRITQFDNCIIIRFIFLTSFGCKFWLYSLESCA